MLYLMLSCFLLCVFIVFSFSSLITYLDYNIENSAVCQMLTLPCDIFAFFHYFHEV